MHHFSDACYSQPSSSPTAFAQFFGTPKIHVSTYKCDRADRRDVFMMIALLSFTKNVVSDKHTFKSGQHRLAGFICSNNLSDVL